MTDAFGWGFALWLFGYILGIVFFPLVPTSMIGWVITPFGILATLWVLFKKIKTHSPSYALAISVVWTFIAIVCDYFFLVKLFKPADGYYKVDVYLYYLFTFALPLLASLWEKRQAK